jgi:hypothetical protein
MKAINSLADILEAASPGGIEAQEARGQIEQSFAETLPKKGTDGNARTRWQALGFVFGTDADKLFVNVKFPTGWRKKPTEHSMWSELLDDKGRIRGMIFYKAAFYDRDAHISLSPRFAYSGYQPTANKSVFEALIMDAGKPVHTLGTWKSGDHDEQDKLKRAAMEWLHERYPNHEDVAAYWDLP